jgi:nucleotidyltransferase substrate binding protein (TIGR01987 family)
MASVESIKSDFGAALQRLEQALQVPGQEDISRDAAILRFRICFDLSCKLMAEVLVLPENTSEELRELINQAHEKQLIGDVGRWLGHFEVRRLAAYAYREAVASDVYKGIPEFVSDAMKLLSSMEHYKA